MREGKELNDNERKRRRDEANGSDEKEREAGNYSAEWQAILDGVRRPSLEAFSEP